MDQTTQLLEHLNSFYSSAFNNLVLYTVALVALIGVVIPVVITWIQNRSFRHESETLRKELSEHADRIRSEVESNMIAEMEKKMYVMLSLQVKDIERKIEIKSDRALGGLFFIQGNLNFNLKHYDQAITDYCSSTTHCLSANDEANGQRTITKIILLLDKIKKADLNGPYEINESLQSLLKFLRGIDTHGRYRDRIDEIDRKIKNIESSID